MLAGGHQVEFFGVFGKTQTGIETRFPGLLANTMLIRPMNINITRQKAINL